MADKKTMAKIKKKIQESINDSLTPSDPIFLQMDLSRRLVLEKAEIDGYLKGLYDCKQITDLERYELSEEFKKKLVNQLSKSRKGAK